MTKKRFGTMAACLALVGAVAVGGTLALLTSQSNEVKNTFSVGSDVYPDQALTVDEAVVKQEADGSYVAVNETDNRTDGNVYNNLVAGTTVLKDPEFVLKAKSPVSWVVARIDGVAELKNVSGYFKANSGWYKYDETTHDVREMTDTDAIADGYYIYETTVNATETDVRIPSELFRTLSVGDVQAGEKLGDIYITGCAVQAVGDSIPEIIDGATAETIMSELPVEFTDDTYTN